MKKERLVLLLCLLISCGPMEKNFERKNYKEDLKEIQNTGLPERDFLLLDYYISNMDTTKGKLPKGITYKELLEIARNEKMKKEISALKREDSLANLNSAMQMKAGQLKNTVEVSFVSIAVLASENGGGGDFSVLLNITNKGKKDIKGIKGYITFRDLFGELIKKTELKYDLIIKGGEAKTYYMLMKYNEKSESDQLLANTEEEKLRFIFEAVRVLFLDGTELNLWL